MDSILDTLLKQARSSNYAEQEAAIRIIAGMGEAARAALPSLIDIAEDEANNAQWNALRAIGRIGSFDESIQPTFRKAMLSHNLKTQLIVLLIMDENQLPVEFMDAEVTYVLKTILLEPDIDRAQEGVLLYAIKVMRRKMSACESITPALVAYLKRQQVNPFVAIAICEMLGHFGKTSVSYVEDLINTLEQTKFGSVKQAVFEALIRIGMLSRSDEKKMVQALNHQPFIIS